MIVDDGSTDDSVDFVKPFLADHRFRLIRKENGGVSSARNLGVESAKGDYVIFLDADDFFLPKAIERLVYVRDKYQTNIACGRSCNSVRGTLRRNFAPLKEGIIGDNFKEWVKGNYSPRTGCALFKRELKVRNMVETIFSQLNDQILVIRNYAKDTCGLFAGIICKVSTMTALQYINNRPIGRIKYTLI